MWYNGKRGKRLCDGHLVAYIQRKAVSGHRAKLKLCIYREGLLGWFGVWRTYLMKTD